MKKYFPHISITLVAGLLGIMYFFPEINVQPYANIIFAIYIAIIILSIVVLGLVKLIEMLVVKSRHMLDENTLATIVTSLDKIYRATVDKNAFDKYYTPILSLVVVFLSGSLGFWMFAILEAISEVQNVFFKEKSYRYIKAMENVKQQ